ncbi:MAG: molybdenum cofactor guanylyltransferase [Aestuariivirga sp.]
MKVLGAIIAGGKSSRMGQDKAFIEWRGKNLLTHVIERLSPQVDVLIINSNADPARFALPVMADQIETGTPVAGLHAALTYASEHGFDAVLTSPCDTPLLPLDLRARLSGSGAAIAVSSGQAHYLTGLWPVECLKLLDGLIRVKDFAAKAKARQVEWLVKEYDPFININTPQDVLDLPGD